MKRAAAESIICFQLIMTATSIQLYKCEIASCHCNHVSLFRTSSSYLHHKKCWSDTTIQIETHVNTEPRKRFTSIPNHHHRHHSAAAGVIIGIQTYFQNCMWHIFTRQHSSFYMFRITSDILLFSCLLPLPTYYHSFSTCIEFTTWIEKRPDMLQTWHGIRVGRKLQGRSVLTSSFYVLSCVTGLTISSISHSCLVDSGYNSRNILHGYLPTRKFLSPCFFLYAIPIFM